MQRNRILVHPLRVIPHPMKPFDGGSAVAVYVLEHKKLRQVWRRGGYALDDIAVESFGVDEDQKRRLIVALKLPHEFGER